MRPATGSCAPAAAASGSAAPPVQQSCQSPRAAGATGSSSVGRWTATREPRRYASPIQGHDGITRFWQGARETGITGAELETLELHPLGDGAYELGRASLTFATGATAAAKYVVIWKQEDGRWRWHVDIWNMEPAG